MDNNVSIIFGYVLKHYPDHIFWIFYVLNLIFASIAYKLGFARQLPLLKSVLVYILLAFGTFILAVFSILKLPITESLIIISFVLGIYRYRLHQERSTKKTSK